MNEEEYFIKRIKDLADSAYRKNVYTNTGFLNMAQLSLFYREASIGCPVKWRVYGGSSYCERAIVMFGSVEEFGYEQEFPISCIHVRPSLKKFADKLTHRDFLGALINLGIKREVLGDIVIYDNEAFIFCMEDMAQFIKDNLDRVKHTVVKCEITKDVPDVWTDNIKEININGASKRLDVVVGEVYRLSRSQSQNLIREKKVFVNARQCENNSGLLKDGDTVSVRGYGKFIFVGENYISKKGRLNMTVKIFQ